MFLISLMFCVLLLSRSVVHNHYGSSPQALSACLQWLSLVPESSGNSVVKNGNVMTAFESKLIGIAHGGDARARASARARARRNLIGGRSTSPTRMQSCFDWPTNLRMDAMKSHFKFNINTYGMKLLPMSTQRTSS